MQTMTLIKRTLGTALLVSILSSPYPIWAGSEVSAATPDPKQIEIAPVDAKQIQATDALKKPAWLTEASVTVKESYDSNVFLTNADRVGYPAVANVSSWVTSVTPKVAVDFAPFLDLDKGDKSLQALNLFYAPEIVRYHDAASENYEAHRMGVQAKGVADSFSYSLDDQMSVVHGNRDTPQYNQVSAIATGIVRERRDQFQEKGKLVLRNDWDQWFVRGVGTAAYYDLNTNQHNPIGQYVGWQNYIDRYDVNGGIDFGYKITPDFAATLGYRHGYEYQSSYNFANAASNQNDIASSPANASNDYNRVLGGFEGSPFKWLKMEVQAGPDFHEYDPATVPVGHQKDLTRLFIDGKISAEITSKDTLAFSVKQWQWVASTGVNSYEDKVYDFTYRHKFLKELSAVLGYTIQGATYDAPYQRSDWQFTYSAGLKYDIDEHFTLTADYSYARGENDLDQNTLAPGREYDRHLVSLGLKSSF